MSPSQIVHNRIAATMPPKPEPEPVLSRVLFMLPLLAVLSLSELVLLVAIILPWGE